MGTEKNLESKKQYTPRERFWQIWGKVVGILVVSAFALLLVATSNPWDSFSERLAKSVPLAALLCLGAFILMLLGFPFSRLFSGDPKDARPDSGGETIAKGTLDLVTKFFAHQAGRAGAAAAAGPGEAASADAGDSNSEIEGANVDSADQGT